MTLKIDDRTVYVEDIWGKYEDDIQFTVVDEDGNVLDLSVHEYVSDNYAAELYEAWYMNRIQAAEDYSDMER